MSGEAGEEQALEARDAQSIAFDSTTFAPMEGAVDRGRPRRLPAGVGATAITAFAIGTAATWFVLSPQSVGHLRALQDVASVLGVQYPWQPELAASDERTLPSSWSAPPFIPAGAYSHRPLTQDGPGRSVAAERELDASGSGPERSNLERLRIEPSPPLDEKGEPLEAKPFDPSEPEPVPESVP